MTPTIATPRPSTTAAAPIGADKPDKLLVSEGEAGRLLGVSGRTVFTLAKRGELKAVKIGARKLYSLESLKEFIRRREAAGGNGELPDSS